jgi:L-asparaginase
MKITKKDKTSILIIYTGGTIGMVQSPHTGTLAPVRFDEILSEVPELNKFNFDIRTITFNPPLDSSNMSPSI